MDWAHSYIQATFLWFQIDPERTLFEQSNELPYSMAWEFPRKNLMFIKVLGSGQFGEVWLCEAIGIRGEYKLNLFIYLFILPYSLKFWYVAKHDKKFGSDVHKVDQN